MFKLSLRECVLLTTIVALLLGWYLDRSRHVRSYDAISREHGRLFRTTHVYQEFVQRTTPGVGMEIDLANFPIAAEEAGDLAELPKLQSWTGK